MKKYTCVLFFLLIFHLSAICQNKQQLLGLRLTSAVSNFSNNSLSNRYQARGLSYELGITTQIQRPNKIGLNGEVSFSRKNVKDDYFDYALNYFVFGIMPNYYIEKTKSTIYIGEYIALLSSYKVINAFPRGGDQFYQFDTGITLGINQKIMRISDFQMSIDARFNRGFISIRDATWQGKTKNYGYCLGVIISRVRTR